LKKVNKILREREAERRFRRKTACGQKLDPEIDIAIGLGPIARLVMQRVTRVVGRMQRGDCVRRLSPRGLSER
jgi:hypothetical protein